MAQVRDNIRDKMIHKAIKVDNVATIKEISKSFGLSYERIRQIVDRVGKEQ